jgi:hypothetical protein
MSSPDKNTVGGIRGLGPRPILIALQDLCWKQAVATRHFAKAGHERVPRGAGVRGCHENHHGPTASALESRPARVSPRSSSSREIVESRVGSKLAAASFLSMPFVGGGPHEQHPFSFANVPTKESRKAVFLIKAHNGERRVHMYCTSTLVTTLAESAYIGVTKRLLDHLQSESQQVQMYIDGPYGVSHDVSSYDTVLLVAGEQPRSS